MRKKILIMAYAVSPVRGSEYSLGWNFVTKMAKHNDVVVLYGTSGDYFGDAVDLQNHLKNHQMDNVEFVLVEPDRHVRILNHFNKMGFGPAFYMAFKAWHRIAYKVAVELCRRHQFDLVHQLGPIGFREPGYLWKLGLPFVWGPVGGAQFVHKTLLENVPWPTALLFRLKNAANYLQLRFSSRVNKAASAADEIIFATEANRVNFARFLGVDGPVISELACSDRPPGTPIGHGTVQGSVLSEQAAQNGAGTASSLDGRRPVKAVWCGHLSSRKNLHFLFHALARVRNRDQWTLTVIGDGKIRPALEQLAEGLGITGNINWAGRHSRAGAIDIMKGHDLHLMCSLAEANTSVFYEATDLGIPTVALNQDGMTRELSHGNGVLVEIKDYDATVEGYACSIDRLIEAPQALQGLKTRTMEMQGDFSWEKKIRLFDDIYEKVLKVRS